MGLAVCGGATLMCSFGAAPATFMVTPANRCTTSMSLANIMDNKPFVNIMPFGMCRSMANPTVAAATAAAFGTLTPMPCIPNTTAPWSPGSPTVTIANFPALNQTCKLMCMWGGVIQVQNPGQTTITVP
jgi:hypothetical protein